MGVLRYENGVLRQRWDDTARTYTEWDAAGVLIPSTQQAPNPRPYTPAENARADADAAAVVAATNQATIEQALSDALATLQAIIDDTNTNINSNPAQRIKDLARAQRRAIRLLIRRFDGTA